MNWTTRDGRVLTLQQMTDAHLANSLAAIEKNPKFATQATGRTYIEVHLAISAEVLHRGLDAPWAKALDNAGQQLYTRYCLRVAKNGHVDAYQDRDLCRLCHLHKRDHLGDVKCLFEPTTHQESTPGWFMLTEEERQEWRVKANEAPRQRKYEDD